MKHAPNQLPLALPPDLDDDTVFALWCFLNDLMTHFESVYLQQLLSAVDAHQPPRDPERPWRSLHTHR